MPSNDTLDYEEVVEITPSRDIRDLVKDMGNISFGGRKFGEAYYILKEMLD